jgi:16S rRNA pseudouridine516 synthase
MAARDSKKTIRLDKYLSSVTELSRSQAKIAIKHGEVLVNGRIVDDGSELIPVDAVVHWTGMDADEALRQHGNRYFMLYKPEGYVCATKDRMHPTVIDLIEEDNAHLLHIAGRLDIDTTGLVLITDDGEWSHRITSPRSDCNKTYYVETAKTIGQDLIKKFAEGVFLHGEKRRCLPAQLDILDDHTARLTIQEGKYHQVKRMFAMFGNEVEILHRESIGDILLDEALEPGEYRPLTEEEIMSVLSVSESNE